MQVSVNTEEVPYRASHAILLYGQHRPGYASVHDVEVDSSGELSIEAGVPATVDGLRKMFDSLDPSRSARPVFLEPNVLSQGPGWLVWWMRPQTRRVWFESKEIQVDTAEVPHPGLVFSVTSRQWRVFAVKGKSRPRPGTKLYQAPYWNVWKTGGICVGSSQTPSAGVQADPADWEESFFSSRFSHPNIHEQNLLVKYRGGSAKFWNAMLKGKFKAFPLDTLVPTELTVRDVLAQIGRDV